MLGSADVIRPKQGVDSLLPSVLCSSRSTAHKMWRFRSFADCASPQVVKRLHARRSNRDDLNGFI